MEALKKSYNKIISLKLAKKIIIVLVVALFFEFLLFPIPSMAVAAGRIAESASISQDQEISVDNADLLVNLGINKKVSEGKKNDVKWSRNYTITAYNSEPGQTDNSPCITANNFNVCENGVEDTVAANFLPFGAKVKIPELFGDRVFIVRDRMNRRHTNRVDVWMLERRDAVRFGVKYAKVEVLE